MSTLSYVILFYNALFTVGCTCMEPSVNNQSQVSIQTETGNLTNPHLTINHSVRDIVQHPAFEGYGDLLLTRDNNNQYYNTSIKNIATLMPYHNAVNPNDVVNALNFLIDEANNDKTVFYSFYSEEQKRQDPSKNYTGLFFFRGDPDAPFAIISPGGGFSYVGSLHEGFPLAMEISSKRLNAFVIRYRIGSEQWATEDLANAISFIFQNASNLRVDTKNYSLWGGSAGARMVGNIAYYGVSPFVAANYPKPGTAVIAYTGQSTYSSGFPPTFITVSEDDWISNISRVERRVQNLRDAGVTVSYERYKNAGHGFGLGTGTDAAGWIYKAIDFWESQITK